MSTSSVYYLHLTLLTFDFTNFIFNNYFVLYKYRRSKKRKAVIQDEDDEEGNAGEDVEDNSSDSFEVASPSRRNIDDESDSDVCTFSKKIEFIFTVTL